MAMTFNTGYYTRDGVLKMDRSSIALHYLKGWFLFDLVFLCAEWTTNLVSVVSAVTEGTSAVRAGKLSRILRRVRLLRLVRLAKLRVLLFTLEGLINSEWLSIVSLVVRNLIAILAMNHYLACLWYAIGRASLSAGQQSWVRFYGFESMDYKELYLVSLHWALSQLTPGPNPIQPRCLGERVFAYLVLAYGMIVATCFVSSITSAMSLLWAMKREHIIQSFLLKQFLHQNSISHRLGSRVTRCVDFVIEHRHKKIHASKVQYLKLLSGPLNFELQTELWEPHLVEHPLFHQYALACKSAMTSVCGTAIDLHEFAKGDNVFTLGGTAVYMYFIQNGALVYHRDGETEGLDAGQWCSEAALWLPWIHCGKMKARAYVAVIGVHAERFGEVTSTHPEALHVARGCALQFWYDMALDGARRTDLPDGNKQHSLYETQSHLS